MKHDLQLLERHTSIKESILRIGRTPYDVAFVVNEQGIYMGGVFTSDLRRLLISGVREEDEVGAYPLKYTYAVTHDQVQSRKGLVSLLTDMQLHGVKLIPLVSPVGEVVDVVSIDDLEERAGGAAAGTSTGFASRKILVVGGAGYLGSILTRRLIQRGFRVRVLDNFLYGRKPLEDLAGEASLEITAGDLRDIHTCVTSLEGIHAVVLLAAIVGDPASKARPTETIETNLIAAQALATACKLQHISRFVYASTCSVYGVGSGALDEGAPLNPVSLYARTKIASEKAILSMGDEYFTPTVLRMGTLYGYSHRMRFDLVVNTMTMKSFTDRAIRLFGGKQWRPLLSVEDAAAAYIRVLEADLGVVGNQVFNVGSDEQNYQIEQIADIISAGLGGIPIHRDTSLLDARDYRVNFSKVREAVGFRPEHSVEESAREIYRRLEDGTIKDPSQRVYYNHYFDATEE
jgi:nucleoside-diphosphate-sugar epimerase